jgi:signal peptidase I
MSEPAPPPSPYAPPAAVETATPPPSPWIAGLLSLLATGAGHIYAGRTRRGVAWALAPLVTTPLMLAAVRTLGGGAFLFMVLALLSGPWIAAIVDAVLVAKRGGARRPAMVLVVVTTALLFVLGRGSTLATRALVVEAFKIPSGSMVPTLVVGDHVFVDKTRRDPRPGDVIVFPFPEHPDQDFVKRVVAMPGDRVDFEKGVPLVNGVRVPQCRVGEWSYEDRDGYSNTHRGELVLEKLGDRAYLAFYDAGFDAAEHQGPWTVKAGEVFVAGDNRHNAHDSRFWFGGQGGGVPIATIRGAAFIVWMSVGESGVDWSRAGASVDEPRLPASAASLAPAFEKCRRDLAAASSRSSHATRPSRVDHANHGPCSCARDVARSRSSSRRSQPRVARARRTRPPRRRRR